MAEIKEVLGGKLEEIRYNLPWADYTGLVAMNPSCIVEGLTSFRHLKHYWDNGRPDTGSMAWGRAVHGLLLEPETFERRFVCYDKRRDLRSEAYRDFLGEAETIGAEVLTRNLYDKACFAAKAFLENPEVKSLITKGQREVTVLANEGKVQCKGRLDWVDQAGYIIDIKTSKSVLPRLFSNESYRLGYDLKLGLYQRWLQRLTKRQWPVFIVVLENKPPFDSAVMPIPDAVLEHGAAKGLKILAQLPEAIATNRWPGVGSVHDYVLTTPSYEMDDELDVDYSDLETSDA